MHMDELERFSRLVALIQHAPLQPAKWTEVVAAITAEVGGTGGNLFTPQFSPSQGGLWASHTYVPSDHENYALHYYKNDPLIPAIGKGRRAADGQVYLSDALVPLQTMRRSEAYNDFYKPLEIGSNLGCMLFPQNNAHLPGAIHITAFRPLENSGFNDDSQRWLQLLVPHLRAALTTHFTLNLNPSGSAADAMAPGVPEAILADAALNTLSSAILLLDRDARVLFANQAAINIFNAADGLSQRQGVLRGATIAATLGIQKFIAQLFTAIRDSGCVRDYVYRINRPSGRKAYSCFGYPLPLATEIAGVAGVAGQGAVMLLIREHESGLAPASEMLQQLYGLTQAEAHLASDLASSLTLQQAATRRNISYATVRCQLKSIFSKTGCQRQAELVALLLRRSL